MLAADFVEVIYDHATPGVPPGALSSKTTTHADTSYAHVLHSCILMLPD